MGFAVIPVSVITVIWAIVGIICPLLVPRGNNKGVIQLCLMLTAATCWLFWFLCYLAQVNPLIGPKLSNTTILLMAREWGDCDWVGCERE